MGDNDTSATSAGKLRPEQERKLLPEEMARARALIEAAANPGIRGRTPLDQWLLDLARARPLWETGTPEGQRKAFIAYARASWHLVRGLFPHDPEGLGTPWARLAGGLQDLADGVISPWLTPEKSEGTSKSPRPEMMRRAFLVAAVEQHKQAGFTLDMACEEIGRVAGIDAGHIRNWRKRILRQDDLQATPEECAAFERWRAMLAGKSPVEIVDAVRMALEALR